MTERVRYQLPDRNLGLDLMRVTEAAALAAGRWAGRGDKEGGDGAAVDAMREVMASVPMRGVVVIGEGEKDEAPMLFNGEEVGDGTGAAVDIAHAFARLTRGGDARGAGCRSATRRVARDQRGIHRCAGGDSEDARPAAPEIPDVVSPAVTYCSA